MAHYVVLGQWTDQGVRNFKDTVDRAGAAGSLAERYGGSMKDLLWTLGGFDFVGIFEFPNDEASTSFMLAWASAGNVRTTTLRAFDRSEMKSIVTRANA